MPSVQVNNVELHYEAYGDGAETIVFSHGFLMTLAMFQAQIDVFKDRFRCIAYDHRGHGRSQAAEDGYEMDNLVADAAALIEVLSPDTPVHFVGMSTGGYVGVRLGICRPELLKSLVLIDTDAVATGPDDLRQYNLMLFIFRYLGYRLVLGRAMSKLFGEKFLQDPARKYQVESWRKIITNHNRLALYKFGKGIFYRESVADKIESITTPTAVIVGEKDIATPLVLSQQMVNAIPGAQLHIIPDSGHTSPVEEPEAVTAVMQQFYEQIGVY